MIPRLPAVVLLAAAAAAGPESEPELLREEPYNFRVVGKLPPGWKRRGEALVFAYTIDDIPHAYVHFVRERLSGDVDVAAQVQERASHYRFPGAPKAAAGTVSTADWGGRRAVRYEHEAKIQGVVCRRRVTALYHKSIWYELIETVYGERTIDDDGCRKGLRVFERGFRLLTPALSDAEKAETGRTTVASKELEFRLVKPEGLRRIDVDPARDPGCRAAFEGGDPRRLLRVRFFEYGARRGFDAPQWFDIFFTSFAGIHRGPRREHVEPPVIEGATKVVAERFHGKREKDEVSTLVCLMHGRNGRVYGLRIRTQNGSQAEFQTQIDELLRGIHLGRS